MPILRILPIYYTFYLDPSVNLKIRNFREKFIMQQHLTYRTTLIYHELLMVIYLKAAEQMHYARK